MHNYRKSVTRFFTRNMQFLEIGCWNYWKILLTYGEKWLVRTSFAINKYNPKIHISNKKIFRPKNMKILVQIGGPDGVMWLKKPFPQNIFWKKWFGRWKRKKNIAIIFFILLQKALILGRSGTRNKLFFKVALRVQTLGSQRK